MSTVYWVNALSNGEVKTDESDKSALYKFATQLDRMTQRLGVTRWQDAQDTTDVEYNFSDAELPAGMESTDELMATNGVWIEAAAAVTMLEALLHEIETNVVRFGWITNARNEVLTELREALTFARQAADESAKFNFSIVT